MLPLSLCACDALLGIREPLDAVWDGGPISDASAEEAEAAPPDLEASALADAGDAEAGVVTATWADWPMPSPPTASLPHPQSYEPTTAGVVVEKVTGLQWQQTLDTTKRSLKDAASYCSTLALAGGGWRLPARIELLSIVDYTRTDPAIDPTTFPGTPGDAFWSSSLVAADVSSAWIVYFGFGTSMVYGDHASNAHYVRCVR